MAVQVHKELVAPSDTKHLAKIRQIVQEVAAQVPFGEADIGRIVLAVDEAVANVMEHAYEDMEAPGDISIIIDADERRMEVVVADNGKEFDPGAINVPNIVDHVNQGKKKGLGIFLMRQIMDEVKYTFVKGLRNELRMIKYVDARGGEG